MNTKLEALAGMYEDWCNRNGFEAISAEEQIARENLTEDQISWLLWFIDIWEQVEDK